MSESVKPCKCGSTDIELLREDDGVISPAWYFECQDCFTFGPFATTKDMAAAWWDKYCGKTE